MKYNLLSFIFNEINRENIDIDIFSVRGCRYYDKGIKRYFNFDSFLLYFSIFDI